MKNISLVFIALSLVGCKQENNKTISEKLQSSSSSEQFTVKYTKLSICKSEDTVSVPQIWSTTKNKYVDNINQNLISNTMEIIGDCPDQISESSFPAELPSVEFKTYIKNNTLSILQISRIVIGMGEHVTTEVINKNLNNGMPLKFYDYSKISKVELKKKLFDAIKTNKEIFIEPSSSYIENFNFNNPSFYISNDSVYTLLSTQIGEKINSYEYNVFIEKLANPI